MKQNKKETITLRNYIMDLVWSNPMVTALVVLITLAIWVHTDSDKYFCSKNPDKCEITSFTFEEKHWVEYNKVWALDENKIPLNYQIQYKAIESEWELITPNPPQNLIKNIKLRLKTQAELKQSVKEWKN